MQTTDWEAILRTRLFGYAVLYRAREVAGGFEPVEVTAAGEAEALARELELHVGEPAEPDEAVVEPEIGISEIGISCPFGRCGIDGRPLEHVRILHAEQAWVDTLGSDGLRTREVAEGETILVEPGAFVRFRGRPRPGGRVLVAFQTEDRSPLFGHATPLTTAGQAVPADSGARLGQTTTALQRLGLDAALARTRLRDLFALMARAVGDDADVAAAQMAARAAGSYAAGPAAELFDRANRLLTTDVIHRIRGGDSTLFRFPGMFGAVAPLFPLLES